MAAPIAAAKVSEIAFLFFCILIVHSYRIYFNRAKADYTFMYMPLLKIKRNVLNKVEKLENLFMDYV